MKEIKNIIQKLDNYEKNFSANNYNGNYGNDYYIKKGSIPIMVSAPHSVNHFRLSEIKYADMFTGAISLLLHELTDCHLIFAGRENHTDPNFSSEEESSYKKALKSYCQENNIRLLIDIHGMAEDHESAIELGTIDENDSSLGKNKFIKDFFFQAFAYYFKGLEKGKAVSNKNFKASNENTITNYISSNLKIPSIQTEINYSYRVPNKENEENIKALIEAYVYIIKSLGNLDWNANSFKVFKSRQAKAHKPQDLVSVNFSFLGEGREDARGHNFGLLNNNRGIEFIHLKNDNSLARDEILLTNRLISLIFSREWKNEEPPNEKSLLYDKPIILHIYDNKVYEMGLPKVEKIDYITFSDLLYDDLKKLSSSHKFMVYNEFLDTRISIDFNKAKYGDKGRVLKDGKAAKKIMIPRYFKLLLGYIDYPIGLIRKEEFEILLDSLDEEKKELFKKYYRKMQGENYFVFERENFTDKDKDNIDKLAEYQKDEIVKNSCQLLIAPIEKFEEISFKNKVKKFLKNTEKKILNYFVGSRTFLLRSKWSVETDDRHGILRVSENIMTLLGMEDNDLVEIGFGENLVRGRLLKSESLNDYTVEVPATIRRQLGLSSINDIVYLRRDMLYNFKRHSIQQAITFLGTVFTVSQLPYTSIIKIIIVIIIFPLMLWWILNEERIKVK